MANSQFKALQFLQPFRSLPPDVTPAQIQDAAKALNSSRFAEDFCTWFLPANRRGKGTRNLQQLSDKAAEFLIDLFISVQQNLGRSSKIPKGHDKYQVQTEKLNFDVTLQ